MYLCLTRWKWFALSFAVTLGITVFYILPTPQIYIRTASVLIKEDSKEKFVSSVMDAFSHLGLFQSRTNVNNELIAFQSPALRAEVMRWLHVYMNYELPEQFHLEVTYRGNLPVRVSVSGLPENESAGFTLKYTTGIAEKMILTSESKCRRK